MNSNTHYILQYILTFNRLKISMYYHKHQEMIRSEVGTYKNFTNRSGYNY